MNEEVDSHRRKQWERIEVLGLLDSRNYNEDFTTREEPIKMFDKLL